MEQTFLFKVPGRPSTRPLVILSGIAIERRTSSNHFRELTQMLSRALSRAYARAKCSCPPVRIARALFSAKATAAVSVLALAAMWWHNVTVSDVMASQQAVALDAALAFPWLLTAAIRAGRKSSTRKGGAR